ncbi:TRAP transporter substrate-binding protein DctP [Pseudovibrio ascidiaceicola]|uniref:TRAP-type C4-dicarboxylate transport system, substrate-binding protein n=1 Tax=Pseudovibrio ascidiaceicola TaxID=285279 RepID=A0A1I4E9C2_9HYPH|nr:TRAP transporter substrate-binding protein DctP [Pseudovibrio ascidiaceicola]SFL02345.1 TRAP-type C4-dicarboxylate transport system, substrate-binding protein [Pseudovibrio ascidiaceicola]
MTNFTKFAVATALTLSLTSGVSAATTLKLAGVVPVEHYGNTLLEQIKNDIEAANVDLKVNVFPAGQLGAGEELFEAAARGNVDLVHSVVYAHSDPVLEINSLPYLVSSWDEAEKVYLNKGSAFNKIFAERLEGLGLKLLANAPEGFIGVVANDTPDNASTTGDKGMNIRVWSSQVIKATVESIGFKATTMNWGEVFPAIQAGTVDGAICCTAQLAYSAFATSDVGKAFIPYNAVVENTTYYASSRTWDKLSQEQQSAVQSAFDKAARDYAAWGRNNEAQYVTKLQESGYQVVTVSDEDRAAIAEKVRADVWPQISEIVGKDTIDALMADK